VSRAHDFLLRRLRSAEDEAASPKYAHTEIERRWLVDATRAAALNAVEPITITDRYIHGTRLRLREMRRDETTVWKLTKKYECVDPVARPIVTAYLSREEYVVFATLPAAVLRKQRFKTSRGGLDYSLDRFEGALAGLQLAEIELADECAVRALPDPDWCVRDITHDPRYQGGSLARYGIPEEA
jgi:CYTH domain-containing protein